MEHIFYLLSEYRYLLLFPLAIVEGPIIAVIAGFLCTGYYLNPWIVLIIIVMGDITGDSLVYLLGRFGVPPFIKRITIRFGVMHEKIQSVHAYFDANPAKTISLSKITLGVGFAGIYLAGYAKIPYNKFIRICLIISALQYVVYLSIGVLFGSAYKQISQYMDYFTALIIILTMSILLFVLIRLKRNKI